MRSTETFTTVSELLFFCPDFEWLGTGNFDSNVTPSVNRCQILCDRSQSCNLLIHWESIVVFTGIDTWSFTSVPLPLNIRTPLPLFKTIQNAPTCEFGLRPPYASLGLIDRYAITAASRSSASTSLSASRLERFVLLSLTTVAVTRHECRRKYDLFARHPARMWQSQRKHVVYYFNAG